MPSPTEILRKTIEKFERRTSLSVADKDAILSLPFKLRTIAQHRYIVRDGADGPPATLLIDGLGFRYKITKTGARQILSVHIPGDFLDLECALLGTADHNVQALTTCEVATVEREAIIYLIETHPHVAHALWIDTLIDAAVYREWVVNVGRRDAITATCHLLCELARRLEVAGLMTDGGYELLMTQEQLADSLGISSVHVNRVVRELNEAGLIIRDKRFIRIPDWQALSRKAGFNDRYLHLDCWKPTGRTKLAV